MTRPWCPGKIDPIWTHLPVAERVGFCLWETERPTQVKRVKRRCPKCGRLLILSVKYNQDGDYIIHSLPPHKIKGTKK